MKIGDKVFHVAADKYGKVEEVWDDGKETRCLVRHSFWLWSVPLSGLRSKKSGELLSLAKS